jgi:hypothetical protein
VRAALAAAGQPDKANLVHDVAGKLPRPQLRDAAAEALSAMGPGIIPDLRALLEDSAQPSAVRCELPRVLATLGGVEARDALVANLFEPDVALRTEIVAALSRLHERERELDVDVQTIEMALTAEIMGHYRSYQILGTVGETFESQDLVTQGLRHAMAQEQERILRLVDPLLPDQDMDSVSVALRSQNPSLRANALELLDNVLTPQLRELVVPLFDGQIGTAERVSRANEIVGAKVESPEQAAMAMLASEDAWLQACGAYAAGALRLRQLRPQIERMTTNPDALLRETARAALARLEAPAGAASARPRSVVSADVERTMPSAGETFGVG